MAHIELARLFIANSKIMDKHGFYLLPEDDVHGPEEHDSKLIPTIPIEVDILSTQMIMEWEETFRCKVEASLSVPEYIYDTTFRIINPGNSIDIVKLKILIISKLVSENTIEVAKVREYFQYQLRALLRQTCNKYIKVRSKSEALELLLSYDDSYWESERVNASKIDWKT